MQAAQAQVIPAPGAVIAGKFRVEAELGRGGMGVVLRGTDPTNRPVAIKVLLPEAIAHPEAVPRFVNEARAALELTSEHAVRVYEAGTLENGLPFMVMELLDGQDLATILEQRGKYTVPDACDAIIDACDALAEAHGRGMVHRDLKPANLFAARGGDGRIRIKVLDFGVSKVAAQMRQIALTSTGTALGTPHYMAPEQLKSAKGADARADIWSLGVVLYELLAGTQPFDGKSFGHLFMQIVSEDPTPLAKYRPDVPAGISDIVVRCMKKNRDERYPDLAALVAALARFASPSGQAQAARIASTRGAPVMPESARNIDAAAPASQPQPQPPKPNLARTAFMPSAPSASGSSPGFVPQYQQQQRGSQPMQPVASSGHMPVAPPRMQSSPSFNVGMDPSGRMSMPLPPQAQAMPVPQQQQQQQLPQAKKLSAGALVAIIAVFALMLIVGVVGIFAARHRMAPH